ncbi:SWIM zinc finger family protein [Myroides pelagicus]|uniref:SWIM zinc finger family protein n=1 Tax=Myroides pelagicus TaxID=270914 RepID=UPI002DB84663|nr:SWIM zinc finger family protein [Myroides pelagicus]MEC4114214.1 SWIM zinc finger family protein [Myroides pelagicus]
MIKLDNSIIEGLATNASATKNGKDLVNKGKFNNLHINNEQDLIWGECAGSGKNPYRCSVDFIDEHNPVGRCSCPSRQFPCKHALGLMYAYVDGLSFSIAEPAEDLLNKREKVETRKQKKEQEKVSLKDKAAKPKKVNKATLLKKYNAQMQGLELADKLFNQIIKNGLSSIDAQERSNLKKQVKELGNYHINGIQAAFDTLITLTGAKISADQLISQINLLGAILKKAKTYIQERIDNPELTPEIDSSIEELIGTIWKLTDLISIGLYKENVELIQLAYTSIELNSKQDSINEGVWFDLSSCQIYRTYNHVPAKAKKYIKEEDSIFEVLQLKDLYIYPGDKTTRRIRWEDNTQAYRPLVSTDYINIINNADSDYASLIKKIKGSIKNPMNTKSPFALLSLEKVYQVEDNLVIEDTKGNRLTLINDTDNEGTSVINTTENLKNFLPNEVKSMALLVRFRTNLTEGTLYVEPVSLITEQKIIRLLF